MCVLLRVCLAIESLSARRAWIEIHKRYVPVSAVKVALRKESVDRNYNATSNPANKLVALRKESVDRNCDCCSIK